MKQPDRKKIFKRLEDLVTGSCGKYLDSGCSRKYFIYMRDRKEFTTYYLINLKGNYIRGYKINHIDQSGESINLYMSIFIPTLIGEKASIPVTVKKIISKHRLKNYTEFFSEFKKNSESLEWLGFSDKE